MQPVDNIAISRVRAVEKMQVHTRLSLGALNTWKGSRRFECRKDLHPICIASSFTITFETQFRSKFDPPRDITIFDSWSTKFKAVSEVVLHSMSAFSSSSQPGSMNAPGNFSQHCTLPSLNVSFATHLQELHMP